MENFIYLSVFVLFIMLYFSKYVLRAFIWLFVPEAIKGNARLIAYKRKLMDILPDNYFPYNSNLDGSTRIDPISAAIITGYLFPSLKSRTTEDDKSSIVMVSDYLIRVMHAGKKYTLHVSVEVFNKIKEQKAKGIYDISIVVKRFAWKYSYIVIAE